MKRNHSLLEYTRDNDSQVIELEPSGPSCLQVLSVQDQKPVEDVVGHSDICSAISEKPAEDTITIELPKPAVTMRPDLNTVVLRCCQDDDGERAENWLKVDKNVTETDDRVKLPNSVFGQ